MNGTIDPGDRKSAIDLVAPVGALNPITGAELVQDKQGRVDFEKEDDYKIYQQMLYNEDQRFVILEKNVGVSTFRKSSMRVSNRL